MGKIIPRRLGRTRRKSLPSPPSSSYLQKGKHGKGKPRGILEKNPWEEAAGKPLHSQLPFFGAKAGIAPRSGAGVIKESNGMMEAPGIREKQGWIPSRAHLWHPGKAEPLRASVSPCSSSCCAAQTIPLKLFLPRRAGFGHRHCEKKPNLNFSQTKKSQT